MATWGTPHSAARAARLRALARAGSAEEDDPRAHARARLLAEEALVVPHEEVRLHLPHGVERHPDHDEQAGPAEVERRVEPADEEVRQHRDEGEEDRARQRDAGERPVDVLRRLLARPHSGDEPAVLLHVVGEVDGVEHDGGVEVGEEDDEAAVQHGVGEVAGRQGLGDDLHPRVTDEPRQGGREQDQRGGEDHRDDAGGVDPEGDVGGLAPVDAPAHHPLGVLDGDFSLPLLHHDDRGGDDQHHERAGR